MQTVFVKYLQLRLIIICKYGKGRYDSHLLHSSNSDTLICNHVTSLRDV